MLFNIVIFVYSLCATVVFLSMAGVINSNYKKLKSYDVISNEILLQVPEDWQIEPFVDAIVVTLPANSTNSTLACP